MKKIISLVKKLETKGISNIKMIALISETSSEVIFYGTINGKKVQSNNMVEEGLISSDIIFGAYDDVASIVRTDKAYNPEKMNIIKVDSYECSIEYEEKKCKTYKIIKAWEKTI